MSNLFAAALFLALCFSIVFSAETYIDIPYYPEGTAPQPDKNLLDIYVPDSATSNTPVFFWIHGGAWVSGDKDDYVLLGENIADQEGYVTVIISYRLSDSLHPEVVHPDHITDVARAFAWTKEHISEYNGDPDRIFICGQSAGGHLCALLFTNTAYLEAEGLSCKDILGAMPISIALYDAWTYVIGGDMITAYQPAFDSDSAIWYDASPKYFLHDSMPPTRIFVAQHDAITIQNETANFYNDMNEYQPTDTIFVDGGHISEVYDLINDPNSRIRRQIVGFMEEVLASSVKETPKTPNSFIIGAYPNPFNSSVAITAPAGADVEIYDLRGNIVWFEPHPLGCSAEQPKNIYRTFIWTPEKSVPSGIYLVRARLNDGEIITKRIVYLK